jgi:ankyrin repeat protein
MLFGLGANLEARDFRGFTPLHRAVKKGHVLCVKMLLTRGSLISAQDNDGETPLHIAAKYAHNECVKALLEAHADINAENECEQTPLDYAVEAKDFDIIKALILAGARPGKHHDENCTDCMYSGLPGILALFKNECGGCGSIGELLICEQCVLMHYCSVACQKKDWRVHKVLCKQIPRVEKKGPIYSMAL